MERRLAIGGMLVSTAALLTACAAMTDAARSREEAQTASFTDTSWTVDRLGASPASSLRLLSLRFSRDRVSGDDGCNDFSGPLEVDRATLRIGEPLIGTVRACPDVDEVIARDFRARLLAARQFRRDGPRLELLDAEGRLLVGLAPAASSLTGTSWKAIFYNNGRNAVTSVIAGSQITLRFGDDGRITGNAGCNAYFAAYAIAGQSLRIQPPASTRRVCADAEQLMVQEASFLQALPTTAGYQLRGDRLELRDTKGAIVASFARGGGR